MRTLLIALAALLVPVLASAQTDNPEVNVFGGYSYLHVDTDNADIVTQQGFAAEIRVGASPTASFGLALDFTSHGTSVDAGGSPLVFRRLTFTAGPQFVIGRKSPAIPFFHAMLGDAHARVTLKSQTGKQAQSADSIGIILGGGVDHRIPHRLAIRILQVDYLLTHFDGAVQHDYRISTGLVMRLGEE